MNKLCHITAITVIIAGVIINAFVGKIFCIIIVNAVFKFDIVHVNT